MGEESIFSPSLRIFHTFFRYTPLNIKMRCLEILGNSNSCGKSKHLEYLLS
jgi:hypothetical protein